MESRFLLTKKGCPFCRDAVKVINKLNLRLPLDKRIRVIDCWEFEEFGFNNIPLMKIFEKEGFDSYPFLYIDGCILEPAPTTEQLNILLKTFLKQEMLIQ